LGLHQLFVQASTDSRVPTETAPREAHGEADVETLEAPPPDSREEAEELYQKAVVELQKPETLEAAALKLRRVLELVPEYPEARGHLGLAHRRLAERLRAQGGAAEAYREARRSLEIDPTPLGHRLENLYEREITSAVAKGFRILEPVDGHVLVVPTCVVRGAIDYQGIVHSVTVAGQPAKFAAGRFDAVVDGLSEGRQTIQVQVVLEGDGGPEVTKELVLTLDTEPPELAVTSPEENVWKSSPCEVSGTVHDATAVTVLVNQLPADVRGGTWFVSVPLLDGEQTLVAEASDAAGITIRLKRNVRVDGSPPRMELLEPPVSRIGENQWVFVTREETSPVRLKVTDEGELASVSIGNSVVPAGEDGNFQRQVSLADGKSRIEIIALDRAGNEVRRSFDVVRDRTPPRVTLDRPKEPLGPGTVLLSGTVEESLPVSVVVNDRPARVQDGVWTIEMALENGKHLVTVQARDQAGNQSEPLVSSLRVGVERRQPGKIKGFTYVMRNGEGYPEYRQEGTDIIMVLLPGGTFWMGSTEEERQQVSSAIDKSVKDSMSAEFLKKSLRAEAPRHRVTVDRFLVAKYELSQDVWTQIMGQNPSRFKGDRLPVEKVSWEEASEFCQRTGLSLPSEAQWEYACRGETDTAFAFGETIGTADANFNGTYPYGGGPEGAYRQKTVTVRSLQPNAFGLHNMHGNVSEWCADVFDERWYEERAATATNPLSTSDSKSVLRSCRGGSWALLSWKSRSACRDGCLPHRRHYLRGFRPVYSPPR
jgi:formylglycine-generating enzyme required for sulfatase activity